MSETRGLSLTLLISVCNRKHFAASANAFHSWLTSTRSAMMEVSGSLEEQLEATKDKAIEVRAQKTQLRQIEEIGGNMEEKLILGEPPRSHHTQSRRSPYPVPPYSVPPVSVPGPGDLCARSRHTQSHHTQSRRTRPRSPYPVPAVSVPGSGDLRTQSRRTRSRRSPYPAPISVLSPAGFCTQCRGSLHPYSNLRSGSEAQSSI